MNRGRHDNVYVYDLDRKKVSLISRARNGAGGWRRCRGPPPRGGAITENGPLRCLSDARGQPRRPDRRRSRDNVYVYDRGRDKVTLVSRRSKSAGGRRRQRGLEGRRHRRQRPVRRVRHRRHEPGRPDRRPPRRRQRLRLRHDAQEDPAHLAALERRRRRGRQRLLRGRRISANGRLAAFETAADNLGGPMTTLAGDTNVYVYNRSARRWCSCRALEGRPEARARTMSPRIRRSRDPGGSSRSRRRRRTSAARSGTWPATRTSTCAPPVGIDRHPRRRLRPGWGSSSRTTPPPARWSARSRRSSRARPTASPPRSPSCSPSGRSSPPRTAAAI